MTDQQQQQTEPKWTGGDWYVDRESNVGGLIKSTDPGDDPGSIGQAHHRDDREEFAANLATMAASKRLYHALAGLLDACERDDGSNDVPRWMDEARAALASAHPDTGETP